MAVSMSEFVFRWRNRIIVSPPIPGGALRVLPDAGWHRILRQLYAVAIHAMLRANRVAVSLFWVRMVISNRSEA